MIRHVWRCTSLLVVADVVSICHAQQIERETPPLNFICRPMSTDQFGLLPLKAATTSADTLPPCSKTGNFRIAVILVTYPGGAKPNVSIEEIRSLVFGPGLSISGYWLEASGGRASASGVVLGWYTASSPYSCDTMTQNAIALADNDTDLRTFDKLLIIGSLPSGGCPFGGFNTSCGGQSLQSPRFGAIAPSGAGELYVSGTSSAQDILSVATHELTHTFNLGHESGRRYSGMPLGAPGDPGVVSEYGDSISVMGSNSNLVLGHISAKLKQLIGWLSADQVQTATASGTYTIVPMSSSVAGPKALRIPRGSSTTEWLWLEYRQPIGIYDALKSNGNDQVYNGALIHYEDANIFWNKTNLLDFTPGSAVANDFVDPALAVGQSWSDPYSNLSISVQSRTASSLTVSVSVNHQPTCAYSITPTTQVFYGTGGSGTISVTVSNLVAGATCDWSVTNAPSWFHITSGASGTGSGVVSYSVEQNPTTSTRGATFPIAGRPFTVIQGGSTCSFSISPSAQVFAAAGGTGSINVTAPAGCSWTASSAAAWLSVTSGASGTGSGSVNYAVAANPSSVARTGVLTVGGQSATITQNGLPVTSSLKFVPVTPCRVADTRNPQGPFGGPGMGGGETRSFVVSSSACGIPAAAAAFAFNVTVVPAGALGYLSLWPAGQALPVVSTLNSFDGRVKANAAIVPAGANGGISVFATDPTHLILDINGYFVPSDASGNLAFYPLTPCRVADTRNPAGPLGGPRLAGGQARTFPVRSACGLPSTAQAYSLNFTAVPQGTLSYLTTWPAGRTQPVVSTLNSFTGAVVANAAIVPAGTDGDINVFVTDNTDVIIDVNGYFAPPGAAGALSFYPATPCRVSDSRNPAGPFGGPSLAGGQSRIIAVPLSACAIPGAAQAYSLNATVVPATPLGYLTLWPSGGAQPFVSTLNSFDGAVASNAAIVPAGANGAISAFVTNTTDLILDINGYFAP